MPLTTSSHSPASVDSAAVLPDEAISQIDRLARDAVESDRTAGAIWAIVGGHDHETAVLAAGAAGERRLADGERAPDSAPMDPATISRIASMTKSFTTAAVLRLRDEGHVRLDDQISRHVPEAAHLDPVTPDSPAITVRDLLSMSAGLVTDNPWGDRQEAMTREEFAAMLAGGLGHVHAPGTGFEYSNTGFALLGRLIDELTGTPYDQYIAETFVRPLGMEDTAFSREGLDAARIATGHRLADREDRTRFEPVDFDSPGVYGAMAGLYSTVSDVATWVRFLAAADAPDAADRDQSLLRTSSRREMQQLHRLQDTPSLPAGLDGASPGFTHVRGYGFGLVVERYPDLGEIVSHSGGYPGYGSFMVWHRDSGLGVVVLANSKYAPATRIAMDALRVIDAQAPHLLAARLPTAAPRTLEAAAAALDWLRAGIGTGATSNDERADDIADAWFADNMNLDISREERRRRLETALQRSCLGAGALDDLRAEDAEVLSRASVRWTVPGAAGDDAVGDDSAGRRRLRITLLMDPRAEALIQSLDTLALDSTGTPVTAG
ncbi:beta-lactamase family protein [Brachybacterium halotolerans subsp. kimchii]|uniref:serine hydrolase domain-containing protein n=1 Tax=Brachybacterium halotolerans TaxID=2795215 RepID=UPI001E573102|nr:serine hydrolase domain-containing protein [Brachybacterium halotolerans]UEJ81076.1 beta-lactamase family protein [Brachybacterium halotolerans subsp. kimchii]